MESFFIVGYLDYLGRNKHAEFSILKPVGHVCLGLEGEKCIETNGAFRLS